MLVFGELLAGRLEHAPDALSAGGDVRQRAFRLPHFRVEPCQVAAVEASHALAHRVDAGAQAFDALAGSPRLTASLVTQTTVERLPFADLADHAADRHARIVAEPDFVAGFTASNEWTASRADS